MIVLRKKQPTCQHICEIRWMGCYVMHMYEQDIDASWYTGRGVRPVGRFGRQTTGRFRRLALSSHSQRPRDRQRRVIYNKV
uniref:Uncharacterized protein n=1 Tax=Esox lucius TaxID=8010 RepID=A0A6Q2XK53_ESOLU